MRFDLSQMKRRKALRAEEPPEPRYGPEKATVRGQGNSQQFRKLSTHQKTQEKNSDGQGLTKEGPGSLVVSSDFEGITGF